MHKVNTKINGLLITTWNILKSWKLKLLIPGIFPWSHGLWATESRLFMLIWTYILTPIVTHQHVKVITIPLQSSISFALNKYINEKWVFNKRLNKTEWNDTGDLWTELKFSGRKRLIYRCWKGVQRKTQWARPFTSCFQI